MRNSMLQAAGHRLTRTPSVRDQQARRRGAALAAFCALAAAGVLAGLATAPDRPVDHGPVTGPFSYFPSE